MKEEIRKYCCSEDEFCKFLTNNPEGFRKVFGDEEYNHIYDENANLRPYHERPPKRLRDGSTTPKKTD